MEQKSDRLLQASMPALRDFSAGMMVLGELAPDRLTIAQCSFFLLAGLTDSAGRATTFSELREAIGPQLSRSLHTTYRVFLDEGRNNAQGDRIDGLGWLTRETDPKDNRRKYLKLTSKGKLVMAELAATLDQTRRT